MRAFKFVITVFLGLLFFNTSFSQNLSEADVLLQPSELLNQTDNLNGNEAFIKQVGDDNEVDLVQSQVGIEQLNLTEVLQSGDYNVARIFQDGGENRIVLIQNGNANTYELVIEGSDNNSAVIQNGDSNSIIQKLTSTNEVNIEFLQQGNENEIIHIQEGVQAKDFKINQIGNNLQLIITQSDY